MLILFGFAINFFRLSLRTDTQNRKKSNTKMNNGLIAAKYLEGFVDNRFSILFKILKVMRSRGR